MLLTSIHLYLPMIFSKFLKLTEQPSRLEPAHPSLSPFVLGSSSEVLALFTLFVVWSWSEWLALFTHFLVWSWSEWLALFTSSLLRSSAAPLIALLRYEILRK